MPTTQQGLSVQDFIVLIEKAKAEGISIEEYVAKADSRFVILNRITGRPYVWTDVPRDEWITYGTHEEADQEIRNMIPDWQIVTELEFLETRGHSRENEMYVIVSVHRDYKGAYGCVKGAFRSRTAARLALPGIVRQDFEGYLEDLSMVEAEEFINGKFVDRDTWIDNDPDDSTTYTIQKANLI